MRGEEIVVRWLSDHRALRERLLEWEAALKQTRGGNYVECRHAVHVLRDVGRFLSYDSRVHFHREESILFPAVSACLPDCRPLVEGLRDEHDAIRVLFERFHRELTYFNSTGELRGLSRIGGELIDRVRSHLEREEAELHSVIRTDFCDDDWKTLSRLARQARAA